jgi:hypothetical protein
MSDKIARVSEVGVRFARAATRHRVSKDSIRHVISHYNVRFEEPPPGGKSGVRSVRLVYLGDDMSGQALEIMTVELPDRDLLVIHAMALRDKYRQRYEEAKRWRR